MNKNTTSHKNTNADKKVNICTALDQIFSVHGKSLNQQLVAITAVKEN
jgi:hypothetical protein